MRLWAAAWVGILLGGCGDGAATEPTGSAPDPDASLSDAGPPSADAGVPRAPPPVAIEKGALRLEGKATFLYGGEVQYFRVRDPGLDAPKTHALWADTFARMKQAEMNLVTTYLPWDWHSPEQGRWDFSGARDVDVFLGQACAAGMKVIAKPGPLITAEWPGGFGTFGAVPAWWKKAHPEALVKRADGSNFDFDPVPLSDPSTQPSYLHPAYLSAVGEWFDVVAPKIKRWIDARCVVGVQIDNETNLYWSDRFGAVDYNPVAIDFFRDFLKTRYGTVAALNRAHGRAYGAFSEVPAPKELPKQARDNVPARDWYDAGQAMVLEYLQRLRAMLEARGIREPDVLFLTNDSPFTIPATVVSAQRNILVHDGRIKNSVGLAGADLYPKQIPDIPYTDGPTTNFPFQADYFTKLFDTNSTLYTRDDASRFAYAAELQGGFYSLPTGLRPNVSAQATDQLLAKTIGHGLKAGSFYVLRGGLNADGGAYDFQAAIGLNGEVRPRFEEMARWGRFLSRYGAALQESDAVEDPIALVQDLAYAVPQAGTRDDHQSLYTVEYPALYGMLVDAGFNPAVVEAQTAKDLARFQSVFFMAPKMVDPKTAQLLTRFHQGGGVLVQLLDPGSTALDGAEAPEVRALAALFPMDRAGEWEWGGVPLTLHSGSVNSRVPDSGDTMRTYHYQTYWKARSGVAAKKLLVERQAVLGTDGDPVALEFQGGAAPRAFLGAHVASVYNSDGYYSTSDDELRAKRALTRYLVGLAGRAPVVSAEGLRQQAWARRLRSGPVLVFVVNDSDSAKVSVRFGHLGSLGLDGQSSYDLQEELRATPLGLRTGDQLLASPVIVSVPPHGSAVVSITRR